MTGGFLSLYDHSTRNAGLCTLAEQPVPDRHARAACTQAGGAFHTSPDPVS
ncbi:putative transposase domain protein, partial [Escherichia coli PA10]